MNAKERIAQIRNPQPTPAPTPAPPPPRSLSKLKIRRFFRDLGKEATFDAILDAIPHARTDWDDAQDVSTGDQIFTTNAEAFKQALTLTDEQFNSMLTICVSV